MIAAVRSEGSVSKSVLYVALELGRKDWKLALTSGFGAPPVVATVAAGDWVQFERVVTRGRQRFGVGATAPVVSCYEAGRDGFWIHRALGRRGIANRVVDSSSIEVNRRARRTKTDRIDALKLVMMLVRVAAGESRVWSEVRVPSEAAEAARHVSRERSAVVAEQTRLVNQMRSWLATVGARLPRQRASGWWTQVCDWAGAALAAPLQARLARTDARLRLVTAQVAELGVAQAATIRAAASTSAAQRLVQLKGVAVTSASILLDEGLEWRQFRNRRQLGGLLGFAPSPYASGETHHEQGISRAGNDRLQAVMVQLAWGWVHWQPDSALTQWYRARFGQGRRSRKIGIVALARKLLIALWRWATQGVVPTGAILKTA
jgi:transposase